MGVEPIIIVGAGPAGLVLALSLAKYEVQSIILEKETHITEDPRGVYLAGDAVRVLYQIGIQDSMEHIGHRVETVNFHRSSFQTAPFLKLDLETDFLEQAVPGGYFQIQPRLEATLRAAVDSSPYCELRCGCRVVTVEEAKYGTVVSYTDLDGSLKQINASWLVGADGKTGIIRKKFLEPLANIRQETGLFAYSGTWVAANLYIKIPTPESHPDLCFWDMNMTSDEVYDLFWPPGWHFCGPPGKPTACGRFGPREARLWRHEFAEPDWNDRNDPVELMWEHLTPLITRSSDTLGREFPTVTFPKDCIEIRRCRQFTFCQKVVNKWFYKRTILIGDAAHVFPPFGGQGIASGIRDSDSLAWRLAVLSRIPDISTTMSDKILQAWSIERRHGVDMSTRITKQNGMLCNGTEDWVTFFLRKIVMPLSSLIPGMPSISQLSMLHEKNGYRAAKGGFFLKEYGGGRKLSQIYVSCKGGPSVLSDTLLQHGKAVLTLLVLDPTDSKETESIRDILERHEIHRTILSDETVRLLCKRPPRPADKDMPTVYYPCSRPGAVDVEDSLAPSVNAYFGRFGPSAKYVVLRPDLIIFSVARTLLELESCLKLLKATI